ncbi:DUF2092 domain-containing protein [Crenobacter sp. SG2305]|uniref:DUF2092 domain-containing protein n=1 Tax=Crenobacter oryzisoli TaxID=3056844 RepID=UPI0025AB51B6|nr:DUF2092 domain-containing protein [Crenobacter sp. SG2305]MDN0084963.1 DUF2092 domain-containing protein [Crenobacter sp. SG2305]
MKRWFVMLFACSLAAAVTQPAAAQQALKAAASTPSDAAEARAMLTRMTDYLAKAQRFSMTIDSAYDAVQASGQKVEFGTVRQVLVSRPDKLRIDLVWRDGLKQTVRFDGKTITQYSPDEKVYASLPKTGTIDDAVHYIVEDLKTPIPLAVFLLTTVGQEMNGRTTEIALVDEETIGGRPTDHLAARTDDVDYQVWIAQGNEPVPLRVVISYKKSPGQPQFSATFSDWNFNPEITPSAFVFEPPADVTQIAFMVPAPEPARPVRARK